MLNGPLSRTFCHAWERGPSGRLRFRKSLRWSSYREVRRATLPQRSTAQSRINVIESESPLSRSADTSASETTRQGVHQPDHAVTSTSGPTTPVNAFLCRNRIYLLLFCRTPCIRRGAGVIRNEYFHRTSSWEMEANWRSTISSSRSSSSSVRTAPARSPDRPLASSDAASRQAWVAERFDRAPFKA